MGNITSRYQRKSAADYNRQQMDEFNALYSQADAAPQATPSAPQPTEKPGVAASILKGSVHGVKKATHELFNSLDELSTFVARIPDSNAPERHNFSNLLENVTGLSKDKLKAEEQGTGLAYNLASGITQFVTAFIPINRAAGALTKGMKLGKAASVAAKVAQGAAAGGVTSAVAFDPYEHRLSNLVQSLPALQNPITEYLQASPGDSKATARMKNGVENALLGAGLDLGIEGAKGLFNALKAYRAAKTLKASGKEGEEALKAAQEVLARESESIRKLKAKEAGQLGDEVQPVRKEPILDPNAKENHLNDTEATAVVQPKDAPEVVNPEVTPPGTPAKGPVADPEFGPAPAKPAEPPPPGTEANLEVQPKATEPVANPEVLPAGEAPLSPDEIEARLLAATKEGRVNALTKLEPERPVEEISKEVEDQLTAISAAKAEGRDIEIIPEIQGEQVPLSGSTPEGDLRAYPEDTHLNGVPDIARTASDTLPSGSLDTPQILPKWGVNGTPEEYQTSILDAQGQPYDIRKLPPLDESLLPKKIQEIAASDRRSVTGFLDSMGSLVGNESGAVSSPGAILAPTAGASSGFFIDYNGDGKVGGWEDISIGLAIGTGGYIAAKTLRKFLHGTPEEKATALTDIQANTQKQIEDFNTIEAAYAERLKGDLTPEAKTQVEHSLTTVRQVRDALVKRENSKAGWEKVLNRSWVREKYKPLVKIPEGKSEAIVQALRDGDLQGVSTAIGKDFNLNGIKAPDDLKEAIDGLTNLISEHIPEETAKMTRGVVSHEATIQGADELGVNLHNVNMLSRDTRKLSERLLAARVAMNSIKTPLLEVMDQILTHADPPAELLMKFREMTSLAAAVQAEVKGSQTEVARALNSMKIAADTVSMDFKSVDQMMAQQGGKRQMVAAVQKLKEIMREGDQIQVNRYLRGLNSSPSLRFLNELHRTVMLSNPITHAANMSGNFLAGIMNLGEDTLAGIFSGRGLGDAKALLEGVAQKDTWMDALRLAKRAWTTSQSTIDPLISKVDGTELAHGISSENFKVTPVGQGVDYLATALGMDGALGRGVDASGKFLRTTFDALGAEDEFFKVINYRGALHREAYLEAYRVGVSEGLEGSALAKRIGTLKAELVDSPTESLMEKALNTTRINTFTANPKGILGSANNLVAKHPTLQLFIPFTRTPTNLIQYVFDRLPGLSLFQQEVRDIMRSGTREQKAEYLARWSTGGLLMSSALGMAAAGMITGGGGENQAAKRVDGWQPYSIKVGDKYYSYNRLDPISSLLGLAADTHEIMQYATDEGDAAKASTAALIAITRNLTSKTMLKGFTEMLDAVAQGDKKMPAFVQNFALSWIPAGAGALEREMDPILRDTISFMDQVKAKTPGLSRTLPQKRDIFGEPITPEGNLGPDFISPVAVSSASKDPVRQMFSDLGIDTKSDLKAMQKVDRVPLTVEQHSRFVEVRGKLLKEALDKIIGNPQFSNLPEDKENPKSKQALIQSIMGKTKTAATGKLLQEFPEIGKAIQDKHKEFAQELQDSLAEQ
ncbi:hypothetical protein [Geobacter sp. SVR]|uniref:hypothetical protein n=1 Tax=Geobacter sp. SVR TaxID=2495594 RepID=UPI00143EFE7F|nr:hypothetical protein [Geobacter sp. SVR]BCS53303.1 hypothetical protein GSVR_16110 [Geobacter sp. SVR]GCF85571.1 hypothetical protein GSbR_21710 [Geobacter sp. SVR]